MDPAELTDRIYEAALLPDLWPTVLAEVAAFGGGGGGLLFTLVNGVQSCITSPGMDAVLRDYVDEGWPVRTDRPHRIIAARHAGFLVDLDVYTEAEIANEPVYAEFLRPRGFGWGIGTAIPVPSGETLFLTVERSLEQGPANRDEVLRLDFLRPHLARAALLSARLGLERVRATTDALDAVGLPAVVIGLRHQPIATNASCTALFGRTIVEGRRLAFTDPAADLLFADAIAQLRWDGPRSVRSIAVAANDERGPLVAHVVPFRRTALDLFAAASAIVVFTPLALGSGPNASILEGLFDLTPAEAKVARDIVGRRTIDEIAATAGLSRETVRSQLKNVFSKTGTSRQVELVSLLSMANLPGLL